MKKLVLLSMFVFLGYGVPAFSSEPDLMTGQSASSESTIDQDQIDEQDIGDENILDSTFRFDRPDRDHHHDRWGRQIYQCMAKNRLGQTFWGQSRNEYDAQRQALRQCQRSSLFPRWQHCRITHCHLRWIRH